MALIDGASGHAIPGLPGAGLVLDALHVVAMGVWVGALVAILVIAVAAGLLRLRGVS
jgi:putative copper export protein